MRLLPSRLKKQNGSNSNSAVGAGGGPKAAAAAGLNSVSTTTETLKSSLEVINELKQEWDFINETGLILNIGVIKAQNLAPPKKKTCNAVSGS